MKSFVSVKGTRHQVTEDEIMEYSRTYGREIEHDNLQNYIQKFIALRILRDDKDENGRYELRHDSLASKIYEKITLVEKELLEIRHFLENAFNNYEKRQVLLSSDDLKYIAPYENKLFLNETVLKFISQSKWAMQRAKRRRQNILIAGSIIIITVLSVFSIWAIRERGYALKQEQIALQQKNSAVIALQQADQARKDAEQSKKKAEENEHMALIAKTQSEQARKEALSSRETAMEQKNIAEALSVKAKEQATIAENEKKEADQQRIKAENAEGKANKLSLLSIAQNLALKSALLDKNPELMGLMAVEAFRLNRNNGGEVDDPIIYNSLNEAWLLLDNARHSIFRGSPNESRALAETGNGLLSIDLDGQLRLWNDEGANKTAGLLSFPNPMNFVMLNTGGDRAVTGHDNAALCIWDIKDNTNAPRYTELKSHKGQVRAAAFSADQQYLATGGKDSLILVWDLQSSAPTLQQTMKNPAAIRAIIFCGKDTLAVALENGSIMIWNTLNAESKSLYSPDADKPLCLAWNPVKKALLAGCSNGTIRIFNFASPNPEQSRTFKVHTAGIDLITFNHEYSLLATGCWDKTLQIYPYSRFFENAGTKERAIGLKSKGNRARSMLFNKDDKLIVGMSDNTIRIWESSSQKLADMICSLVKRNMTKLEWEEMIGKEIPYEKTCTYNP